MGLQSVIRFLKTKEDAVSDVVNDYQKNGGRIVDKLVAQHAEERLQLIQTQQQSRRAFLSSCERADHAISRLADGLRTIKVTENPAGSELDRAKSLLETLRVKDINPAH